MVGFWFVGWEVVRELVVCFLVVWRAPLAASDEAFGREECKGRHASGVVNWVGVDMPIGGGKRAMELLGKG